MKKHYSAGGLIVKEGEAELKYLLLRQKLRDGKEQWVCPKGHIDSGERAEQAARREIYEEAGLKNLKKVKSLGVNSFFFFEDNTLHKKHVYWFLFTTTETSVQIQASEGFMESRWLTFEEVCSTVTHKDFIPFLEEAHSALSRKKPILQ